MIRYAKLPFLFNSEAVQKELQSIREGWQKHFNTFYYEGTWTVLALRSPGGDTRNIIPDQITDADYIDTPMMPCFPTVKTLLSQIRSPIMAVRFLNLQAGAEIKPHRDRELAFEMGEARLHFPIITNPLVSFTIDNKLIPLQAGDCWYINANLMHNVANRGTTDRIHLVVDCKVNDWLKHTMSLATEISCKEDANNADLSNIIRELRGLNTYTSNKLADELAQKLKDLMSIGTSNN
ncbi:aspartyl/asparaginyl beta-hydroxylase domain-containing protein [Mucilaginibacter sabulilitoris]|uniref:Aspartyl/asparaginyl beta-hydroxylase domain-containing protein n=1 Tax=Mucilaginibacter sabulilitoris TaxID=1173583 RepID=A0ABZ0TZP9_9SPHI|nr:aspartyl/asparaginyl beta-hydroxylase domain-containing protein [Mucilaginibacter sabulilitoris]WPU97010.1 aspartyl/asparaginyl beta-hydroxylase domain-containing protein [Mucilaginibacter sabulilitoris]